VEKEVEEGSEGDCWWFEGRLKARREAWSRVLNSQLVDSLEF
jgi:hypothetical protein